MFKYTSFSAFRLIYFMCLTIGIISEHCCCYFSEGVQWLLFIKESDAFSTPFPIQMTVLWAVSTGCRERKAWTTITLFSEFWPPNWKNIFDIFYLWFAEKKKEAKHKTNEVCASVFTLSSVKFFRYLYTTPQLLWVNDWLLLSVINNITCLISFSQGECHGLMKESCCFQDNLKS